MIEPLVDLAAEINQEYALTYYAAMDALEHAILCGEHLIEARKQVPEGKWQEWVEDNLDMKPQAVSQYVRIATYRDHLLAAEDRPTTIGAAVGYLKAIDAPRVTTPSGKKPTFDVDEARRLRDAGFTMDAIGAVLGVSGAAIGQQLDPKQNKERIKRQTKKVNEKRAAARLADQQRVDGEISKIDSRLAHAYEMLRTAETMILHEMDEGDVELVDAMRPALASVHRAEDVITNFFGIKKMRRGRQV